MKSALRVVLLASLGWLPVTAEAAAPSASREQALKLYQQKKYDQACPLFEALANEAPADGALWADLGLCELRRGRKAQAERASRLAVQHDDEKVRKSAYFNLHAAGVRVAVPEPGGDERVACKLLHGGGDATCPAQPDVWVCAFAWSMRGTGGGTSGANALFGRGADAMAAMRKMLADPESAEDHTEDGVALSFIDESSCGYCQMHAWDCTSSQVVRTAVRACFKTRTGVEPDDRFCIQRSSPRDLELCQAEERCDTDLCDRAEQAQTKRALWPEAADEYARALKSCDDCGIQEQKTCEIVSVDACTGRVGYVCDHQLKGKKASRVTGELVLPR